MTALLLSAFIAFLITPAVNFLQRRLRLPRFVGAFLVLLLVLAVLALIVIVLAPIVVSQFSEIRFSFVENLEPVLEWMRAFLDNFRVVFGYDISTYINDLQDRLRIENVEELAPGSADLAGTAMGLLRISTGAFASVLTAVGGFLFTVGLVVVFTVYLVNDQPVLTRAVGDLIPEKEKPDLEDLKSRLRVVWHGFVRGNILLMVVFGFMVGVTMFTLGMPAALLLGIIAGLMDLVPTVGALFAGAIMVAMALFQGSMWVPLNNFVFALLVVGVYSVLQWIEGNVLQPKIMGGSVNLPGFISILGVVVGLLVGGVLGAYLAIPFIASAREIFLYVHKKLTEPAQAGGSSELPPGVLLPQTLRVQAGETGLHVARWSGKGVPILGLHGITANAYAFAGLAFALRGKRSLAAYDFRGRGRSDKPAGPYGVAAHEQDALGVMDALEMEKTVVVGHSFGATVALALAADHPERVSHAVLIDGGAGLPQDVVGMLRTGLQDLRRGASGFEEYVAPARESGDFEEWDFFVEYFYRMEVEEGPGLVRSRTDPHAVAADLDDLRLFNPEPYLQKLAVPVLVLRAGRGLAGTGRSVLTAADGRRLAKASPRGAVVDYPEATHSSLLFNRYEEVSREMMEFLDADPGGKAER